MNKDLTKDKLLPTIVPKAVFGIRTDLYQNVMFFSQDKVAYVAGNYIVITSVKEKNQVFIPARKDLGEITAFSIDENKENLYLALAQKGPKATIIFRVYNKINDGASIEELTEKRLGLEDLDKSNHFNSIAINEKKGFIIAMAGPNFPCIVAVFHVDRQNNAKPHSVYKLSETNKIKHLNLNPYYPNFFSVISEGSFSFYLINDTDKKKTQVLDINSGNIKNFNEFSRATLNMVSSTWVNKNRHACINDMGDIFIVDFNNVKKFDSPNIKLVRAGQVFDVQAKPKWIFSKNNNLYVSKDDGAIYKLEEKTVGEKNAIAYERISNNPKFISNLPKMEVHCISIHFSTGNAIVISSESSQLYYIDIQSDNALFDGNNYKPFLCTFHSEEINCLDVAKVKPLVATCSRDRCIRIWNYINIQLETSELFEDEPTALSFHPNGLHLAVAFVTKYKLLHILERQIMAYKEINLFNLITDIKFSNYGQYLGICYKSQFQILNFYTGETILGSKATEGHTQEIKCLTWDTDDTGFATCGVDGRAFYWQLHNKEEKWLIDANQRDIKYLGVDIVTLEETKKLIAITENELVELGNGDQTTLKLRDDKMKENTFSQIKYDQDTKLLITASSNENVPTIRLARYFFISDPNDFQVFQANQLGITSLKMSYDMTHLFSAGRDHCLFIFQFQNVPKTDKRDDSLDTDLVLVKKEDLDKEQLDLKNKVLKFEKEKIHEEENFKKLERELDNEISTVQTNLNAETKKYKELEEALEKQIKEKKDEFRNEKRRIEDEYDLKEKELDHEHDLNLKNKDHEIEKQTKELENEVRKDTTNKTNLNKKLKEEEKNMKKKYDEIKNQLVEDITKLEQELKNIENDIASTKNLLMEKNDNIVTKKREELEKLKIEYFENENNFNDQKKKDEKEIAEIKSENKTKETKKNKTSNEVEKIKKDNEILKKKIEDHQGEIEEKKKTIIDKNRIKLDLEKENQELEKFKFVLNYKIRELKSEKQPKENKLNILEKQKKDMEREIKNFEFAQENYIINLTKNHQTLQLHEKQIMETEKRIEISKNYKSLFQEELFNAMKRSKNHKDLKREIVNLKRLFLDKEMIVHVEKPYEANYESQRQFLEKNKIDHETKIEDSEDLFSQDHKKLMKENMNLIRIINELERENKEIEEKSIDDFINPKKTVVKAKQQVKESLPQFAKRSGSNEHLEIELKKEIELLEQKIQVRKMEIKENMMKQKKNQNNANSINN